MIGRGGVEPADGVEGTGTGNFSGVAGFGGSHDGTGVFGVGGGANGQGVRGIAAGAPNTVPNSSVGVYGQGGLFDGVQGLSFGSASSGVSGVNSSNGAGISGSSQTGYGGEFAGEFAQLHLVPAAATGHPTHGNHFAGEFFVDANGNLFFCRSGGNPGNWVKLA